ncbi:Spy/CpxP family protein refolding chaperone [Cytophaga aurantiaca]|uniref:Spy/CpxP family protein refolding chaperone n=1 Tax=Cytophaga aurantiaca TaxID=29530 RepID=UPI00036F6EB9|nr:Spy/CpxP family protein refolding chaperone [Cytophaga aurantiaca]
MKELLKNKWAWAVLILVLINIATIGAIWCSMCGRDKHMECHRGEMCHRGGHGHDKGYPEGKHGRGHHGQGEDFLSRELNLNEEQQKNFEALRKEHFEKLKVNFDSMQVLKKSMVQSLGKTDVEIDATIQKIGSLEMTIQKETFDHFNKMYTICTDSQKVILKEKLANVMGHRGPGFAGKGRGDDDQCEHVHGGKDGQKSCCSTPPKRF